MVEYIEPDRIVRSGACQTQNSATWGIDRIDTPAFSLSSTYVYSGTGAGVDVYVLDT